MNLLEQSSFFVFVPTKSEKKIAMSDGLTSRGCIEGVIFRGTIITHNRPTNQAVLTGNSALRGLELSMRRQNGEFVGEQDKERLIEPKRLKYRHGKIEVKK